MRKAVIFLITFILLNADSKAQSWTQLSDFPGLERDDGVAFVINNKAYCGSGLKVGWVLGGDFYSLDLGTETWTTVASLPPGKERQYACGFTDGTNGFVFGGEAFGSDLNDLWMYSPVTNSWTAKASKPGNGVRGASCFVIRDTAYIVGGAVGTINAINEVWAYIIASNTWIQKNNAPFSIWRAAATTCFYTGTLLFGRDANGSFRRELYYYLPSTDTWQQQSVFPGNGRAYATMQAFDPTDLYLYVYCGYDTLNTYYNDLYGYHILSNTWFPINSIPSFGRKGGMGFWSMNTLYYTCGINQSNLRLKETWKSDQYATIKEFKKNKDLSVYPNPATSEIYLKITGTDSYDYEISDISGRVLLSGPLENNDRINVSALSQGVYFVKVGMFSSKLIIQ